MISVSYQGKRLSYSVLRSVPNTIMLRICAVLLLSVLMINDTWAQVSTQQVPSQRSRGVEVPEIVRVRIAEQIAAKRLEKQQGISAAKSNASQQIAAGIRNGFLSAVDVPYEANYFDTQAGNNFSFPEDTHDFCRASFGSDTANPDYYLDASIGAGESLVVTLSWTAPATFADYDLYLFDREGRPAGEPSGIFPNGTIGNNYQTDNSNLVEVASLTNTGGEEAVIAVVDRFRGEAGSMLTVTFTGDDGAFSVLEFIGTDNLTYLNADVDGNGADQTVGPLTDGLTISADVASSFSTQFNTDGCAESVVFTLTDADGNPVSDTQGNALNPFTDNDAPYAAFGDVGGDFNAVNLPPGSYVLTAVPYSQDDGDSGSGVSGTELSVGFLIPDIPPPNEARITGFTLMNADTDQAILEINEGDTLELVQLPRNLNIRINAEDPEGLISDVAFPLTLTDVVGGPVSNAKANDSNAPYALFGETAGDYDVGSTPYGTYALTGDPSCAAGVVCEGKTVNFTIRGPRIRNYTLVDAFNDVAISSFDPIPEGATINMDDLASALGQSKEDIQLNIRANMIDFPTPTQLITSVRYTLTLDGEDYVGGIKNNKAKSYPTWENARPYSVFEDCTPSVQDLPGISCSSTINVDSSATVKPMYNDTNWIIKNGNYSLNGIPSNTTLGKEDPFLPGVVPFNMEETPLNFTVSNSSETDNSAGESQVGLDKPQLQANFPNPFNPVTTIRFGLPDAAPVRLVVYDMLGREVKVLVDGALASGFHDIAFEAGDLASGMYLYRLETPTGVLVRPMTLLK